MVRCSGSEQLCNRADERAIAERDVVAAQDDEIRACGHCELDRLHDVARGDDSTVVNVGDETDAKTVEGCEASPTTGNVVLVMPIRWRSNAAPYVMPAVAEPTVVAITVLMAVRRLMDMRRSVSVLESTVYGLRTTGERGLRMRTGDGILKSHEPV